MSSSEYNLYDLYRLVGGGKFASVTKGRNYTVVSGSEGSWPQMIFDVKVDKNAGSVLNEVFSDAAEMVQVRFAASNREQYTTSDQELLRGNGIFPADRWTLMEMGSSDDLKKFVPADYEIRSLKKPGEIDEFGCLVNTSLMSSQKMNIGMLQELAGQAGIDIYGLYSGGEVVSGLLSYTGENKVAGLYFIATRLDCRGKGLAAGTIGFAVESLFSKGVEKVVLQALPKAVTLYSRMGFSSQGELIIFWKQ